MSEREFKWQKLSAWLLEMDGANLKWFRVNFSVSISVLVLG